jgi:hypothetical protein
MAPWGRPCSFLFHSTLCSWLRQILWLGCSDSRVPESVVTASRPGDIFVHRNIANQVHPDDDSVLSVLTYAVAVVGVEHGTPPSSTQNLAQLYLCSRERLNRPQFLSSDTRIAAAPRRASEP